MSSAQLQYWCVTWGLHYTMIFKKPVLSVVIPSGEIYIQAEARTTNLQKYHAKWL